MSKRNDLVRLHSERIRALRAQGLTYKVLAIRFGTTASVIHKICSTTTPDDIRKDLAP